jgi:hypothetical protein
LAREFGQSSGRGAALRSAIEDDATKRTPERFRSATEPHELSSCFVGAVFDAYIDRLESDIADLLRIATSGTGILPQGHIHPDLVARVTTAAIKTADRFLGIVVRAFDYLPPVDVTFGDVVRAIVTSGRALYPEDTQGLRKSLIEALRRRGIYPDSVRSLTDTALAWPAPTGGLSLSEDPRFPPVPIQDAVVAATMNLDIAGEPGRGVSFYKALSALAQKHAHGLGLEKAGPQRRIAVESSHVVYRLAEDRQPRPELVVQLMQRRVDLEAEYQPDVTPAKRIPLRAGTVRPRGRRAVQRCGRKKACGHEGLV